jgi:acetylornithine/N-succinyldiaminopimelate aminotransferase
MSKPLTNEPLTNEPLTNEPLTNETGRQRWQASMMDNYGTPPITLVRGEGALVWDADGNRYLDLVGGIAVNALGHQHPAVVKAVTAQITTLGHVSNLVSNEPALALAEQLLELLGGTSATGTGRVLLCNSGAEANEAAFKIARRTGRPNIVAAEGSFHGRTMGALSLTGQPAKRQPFEPVTPGVTHVPFGNVDALRSTVDDNTAAVFLEPVLGEGGIVPAPDGYLQAARRITHERGALLVVDEAQTGIGRTGSWFAFQRAGITPDVVTLAKALGGGLPIGACVGLGAAATLLRPGEHGTTFGGNPVCCAAALAVLGTIRDGGLLEHADALGKEITAGIERIEHPLIDHVRGAGLLLGVALTEAKAPQLADAAREAGFLLNPVRPDTLRIAPPLILSNRQAHEFLDALPSIL